MVSGHARPDKVGRKLMSSQSRESLDCGPPNIPPVVGVLPKGSGMTARRALLCLIVVSGALRLGWAAAVGLGHDEAYHYLFTVHRDWSYFDHPPMLALVESIGPAVFGTAAPGALRLGFVVLFAGSTWLLFRLTARSFGEWAGFWAALAMNASAYHTAAAGAFALPDGPLLFFWLLTLDRLSLALETPERLGRWLLVGVAWGGALLSKYHAVFLPMGALTLPGTDAPGPPGPEDARPVPRGTCRRRDIRPRPRVECGPPLGFVRLPGRPRGGRDRVPAALAARGDRQARRPTCCRGSG